MTRRFATTLLIGTTLWGERSNSGPLYDARAGTLPDQQQWDLITLPQPLSATLTDGAVQFSTLESLGEYAGFTRLAPEPLNRTPGFRVRFTLQVLAETHRSEHRSGVSLIVLSADRLGLELAFWTNRVWVQHDAPPFTHGEEAELDTTRDLLRYELSVRTNTYTLHADGVLVLSGAVRDYTAFTGVLDPYETPNFLFLGDDTTSAAGAFRWRDFEILPMEPPPAALNVERLKDHSDSLRLSWPVGYQLQWAESLSTNRWTLRAADSPLIVAPADAVGFFRLIGN